MFLPPNVNDSFQAFTSQNIDFRPRGANQGNNPPNPRYFSAESTRARANTNRLRGRINNTNQVNDTLYNIPGGDVFGGIPFNDQWYQ